MKGMSTLKDKNDRERGMKGKDIKLEKEICCTKEERGRYLINEKITKERKKRARV